MEQLLSIFLPAWEIELVKRRLLLRPHETDVAKFDESANRRIGESAKQSPPTRSFSPIRPLADSPFRSPRRPLLLIAEAQRQQIVARCCPLARRIGIREGMTLSEARALVVGGAPHIFPFDPVKSRQAIDLLATWALRFSPTVCVDPTPAPFHPAPPDPTPDGLLLDVTGEAHLFGGEHLLLTEISARLSRLGFTARLALAPTLGAAWALARFAESPLTIITKPETANRRNGESANRTGASSLPLADSPLRPLADSALSPLPVAALRLPPQTCHALDQVGITLIRHLLALPRETLPARFGDQLLLRLDQAFGRAPELITPLRSVEPLTVRRIFDGPAIQLEAIMITVQELLTQLAAVLLEKESGVRGLKLELLRIEAAPVSREFVLARPTRDARHLWQLIRPKLEQMHLGYGVEAVTLTAHWTQSIPHQQLDTLQSETSDQQNDAHYAAFLDTLINRWDPDRVLAANPVASHSPEAARQFRSVVDETVNRRIGESANSRADVASASFAASPIRPFAHSSPPLAASISLPLVLHDRPTLLFDRPEPVEALALQPDRPPSWLRWRGHEYTLHSGTGPERIATAWWHDSSYSPRLAGDHAVYAPSTRDYFKVQTAAGSWLWTFRELESGRWFVQGTWS